MDWQKIATDQAVLIEQLRAENVALKERIAVLEKNSATSSKPPSSEEACQTIAERKTSSLRRNRLEREWQEALDLVFSCRKFYGVLCRPVARQRSADETSRQRLLRRDCVRFLGSVSKIRAFDIGGVAILPGHLIREVKFLAESKDKKVANDGNRLLKKIRAMFMTIHQRKDFSNLTWKRRMNKHRRLILKTVQWSVPNNKDALNIAVRLANWEAEYFRFIDTESPPTNNLGEQTIRQVVLDRKVCLQNFNTPGIYIYSIFSKIIECFLVFLTFLPRSSLMQRTRIRRGSFTFLTFSGR